MLTKRYLSSTKNLGAIFNQIISGTAPEKFTVDHLKNLGFSSSNDRAVIPLFKDLGFLSSEGTPTQRYQNYRNKAASKKVLGEALKDAYQPIFHISENPTKAERQAIEGLFKSSHNVTDKVSEMMTMTFFSLLDLADISHSPSSKKEATIESPPEQLKPESSILPTQHSFGPNLRYNIEIHLPATKDIEVYNSIFKSIKQHLLDG